MASKKEKEESLKKTTEKKSGAGAKTSAKTAKKVSRKKAVAKKTTAKRAVSKETARKKKTVAKKLEARMHTVSKQKRYEMIANMAYFRAEKRGFEPGWEQEDWLESERLIDEMIAKDQI